MPIAPPVNPPAPLSYRVYDICLDALIESAVAPGENPGPDEAQWVSRKFDYLVDIWQAKEFYVFSHAFNVYSLPANTNPVSIGPSGVAIFSTNGQPRPVRIVSANLLLQNVVSLSDPGLVDLPINIRDHQWWAAQQVKNIQTNIPTDLYYDPTSPDGSLTSGRCATSRARCASKSGSRFRSSSPFKIQSVDRADRELFLRLIVRR